MRKSLLLIVTMLISLGLMSQSNQTTSSKEAFKKYGSLKVDALSTAFDGNETSANELKANYGNLEKSGLAGETIGITTYDLQTNNSVGQRIEVDAAGGIHAVWTYSETFDIAASDRGTGYNYKPANGSWGAAPTMRLEPDRVGWPEIGINADGEVFVIAHFAGATDFFGGLSSVFLGGDGIWEHNAIDTGNEADTWPRIAVGGNVVHVIAGRQGADGEVNCNNLTGGVEYYRSTDGGHTFNSPSCIDGMTPENFPNMTGDGYAIDCSADGQTVAIISGIFRPTVWKSTDAGESWTMTPLIELADPLFAGAEGQTLPEQIVVGDECYSIIVDNDGAVHAWYGANVVSDDDEAAGWSYLPAVNGIMYWNENIGGEPKFIGETVRQDIDGDCEATFDFNTSDAQAYFGNIVSHPSAGIDADGNLYLSYTGVVEGAFDANNNVYRDLFIIKSTDGGANWEGPLNISNDPTEEAAFGSIARTVTDEVHVLYQSDASTGMAVQPDGGSHGFQVNNMQYVAVPVGDIVTPDPNFNTCPQLIFTSVPNVIQGCEVGPERFEAFAIDYPDGELEVGISGVDVTTPSTEAGPWVLTVEDSDGNIQEETIIDVYGDPILISVFEDVDAPIIFGGPFDDPVNPTVTYFALFDTIDAVQGEVYVDAGAIIQDDADGFGCPAELTISNPVDTDTPGQYFVTYDGVDNVGNAAATVTRVVNVIGADLEGPQVVLFTGLSGVDSLMNCGETIVVAAESGGTWSDPGFFAWDNVDGVVSSSVVVDGTVNLEVLGTYEITYTVTDGGGNTVNCTRLVSVQDVNPPIISLQGPPTLVNPCGAPFNDPGAIASDDIDLDLTDCVAVSGTLDVCTAGTYILTYTVSDASGNETSVTRNIIVPSSCGASCEEIIDIQPGPGCATGVGIAANNLETSVNVYPNPTQGMVKVAIEVNQNTRASLAVYNLSGQQVSLQNDLNLVGSQVLSVDLTGQTTGMYFVKIVTDEGTVTRKIILDK